MKKCGIYKITNPSGNIYIGASRDILKRWSVHYKYCCNVKSQKKLYNSFMKHGIENHIFEIVEETEESILFIREVFYIDYYNSFKKGLNLTIGGENPPIQNKPMSDSQKRNIGLSQKGKIISMETREKMRKARTGLKQSEELVEKRASKLRGRESKLKNRKRPNMSEKLKGKCSGNSIKCRLVNTLTNEILEGNSIAELSRKSNISLFCIFSIRKGMNGKKYKHFKYEQFKKN